MSSRPLYCAAGDIHGALNRLYADVLAFEAALGETFTERAPLANLPHCFTPHLGQQDSGVCFAEHNRQR